MKKIGIIDCGTSNLSSVRNAFESQGLPVEILREKELLGDCSHLVLPGVGAFQAGMANLRVRTALRRLFWSRVQAGKPLLGICLGMQFLADRSEEFGLADGLGADSLPGGENRNQGTGPASAPRGLEFGKTNRRLHPVDRNR